MRFAPAAGNEADRRDAEAGAAGWLNAVNPGWIPTVQLAPGDRLAAEFPDIYFDTAIGMCLDAVECEIPPELAAELPGIETPRRTAPTPPQGPRNHTRAAAQDGSDPVDPATGEFIIDEADMELPGLGQIGFAHRRIYRSGTRYRGPLGHSWDHGYNQRLHILGSGCASDTAAPSTCTVLWSTGSGFTRVFAAGVGFASSWMCSNGVCAGVERDFDTPAEVPLTLHLSETTYTPSGGATELTARSWTLTSPDGLVQRFDREGLLRRIEDSTGAGIDIEWEEFNHPGDDVSRTAPKRVDRVIDSAGRIVEYTYNQANLLVEVSHAGSGLAARYTYNSHDELETATNAFGVTETYGYDTAIHIDPPDMLPFIPEPWLEERCQQECSAEPGSGGACVGVGSTGYAACLDRCSASDEACEAMCPGSCVGYCSSSEARESCESSCQAPCDDACSEPYLKAECEQFAQASQCYLCAPDIARQCELSCSGADSCLDNVFVYLGANPGDTLQANLSNACTQGMIQEVGEEIGYGLLEALGISFDERTDSIVQNAQNSGLCSTSSAGCSSDVDDWIECTMTCADCNVWSGLMLDTCEDDYVTPNWFPFQDLNQYKQYLLRQFGDYNLSRYEIDSAIRSKLGNTVNSTEPPCEWRCETAVSQMCKSDMYDRGVCRSECDARCTQGCLETCHLDCGLSCEQSCEGDRFDCVQSCYDIGQDPAAWEALCEDRCGQSCIDASHRGGYGSHGPKYGRYSQLDHNLTHVYDGNGELYLTNVYGNDMSLPSFDRVIRQWNAGYWVQYAYKDLHAEALGYVEATDYVEMIRDDLLPAVGTDPAPPPSLVRYRGAAVARYEYETAAICRDCSEYATNRDLCTFGYALSWHSGGGLPSGPLPFFATVVRTPYGDTRTYYTSNDGRILQEVSFLEPPAGDVSVSRQSTWYEYDDSGRLVGIETSNGDRSCVQHDELGNVVRETLMFNSGALDSRVEDGLRVESGMQLRYDYLHAGTADSYGVAYSGPNRLFRSYLPRRIATEAWTVDTEFRYDDTGVLTGFTTAGGRSTEIENEPFGRPRRVTAASGLVVEATYDLATGAVDTMTMDATGLEPLVTSYDADAAGRIIRITEPTGVETTIDYVTYGREHVETVHDPATARTLTTRTYYNAEGELERVVDDVTTTGYEYNLLGFLRKTTVSPNDASVPSLVSCQLVGPGGRVLQSIGADGLRAVYEHDGLGRVTRVRSSRFAPYPDEWDDDCPVFDSGQIEDIAETENILARTEYDDANRTVRQFDALGRRFETVLDGLGQVAITRAPTGGEVHHGYDKHLRPAWTAVFAQAAAYERPLVPTPLLLSMQASYYHLASRQVISDVWTFIPGPSSGLEPGTWLGDGHLVTTTTHDPLRITVSDDSGAVTVNHLDAMGRVTLVDYPTGDKTGITYSDMGRRVRVWDTAPTASGTVAGEVVLDNAGQPVARYVDVEGALEQVSSYDYDTLGRLKSVVGAGGAGMRYTYDGLGRVASQTRQLGGVDGETVLIAYDAVGRPRTRTSVIPDGPVAVTELSYDWLGRVRRVERPGQQTEVYTYVGPTDLMRTRVDARGALRSYEHDPHSGALLFVRGKESGGGEHLVGYEHDALGRLTRAFSNSGTAVENDDEDVRLGYDSLGEVHYQHDAAFSPTPHVVTSRLSLDTMQVHYGDGLAGMTLNVDFDTIGRLRRVKRSDGGSATWALLDYQGLGGPTRLSRSSTLATEHGYDGLGRLVHRSDVLPSGVGVAARRWAIPLDGVPRLRGRTLGVGQEISSVFTVDGRGRVLSENHGLDGLDGLALAPAMGSIAANQAIESVATATDARRAYSLDDRDNWLKRVAVAPALALSTDVNDFDGYDRFGEESVEFDAAGAMLSRGDLSFGYDVFGRLISIDGPSVSRSLRYDGLGRVVLETDELSGEQVRYAYDGHLRVMRRDASGLWTVVHAGLRHAAVTPHRG